MCHVTDPIVQPIADVKMNVNRLLPVRQRFGGSQPFELVLPPYKGVSDQQKTQFSGQAPPVLGGMLVDALEDESNISV